MKRIIILLFIVFNGCMEKKEAQKRPAILEPTIVKHSKNKTKLTMTLTLKYNIDDNLDVRLKNVSTLDNQTANITLSEKIFSDNRTKKYVFVFPKEYISRALEIDLGFKNEKEITIESINFSYEDVHLKIKSNELNKYFSFSKFTKYDPIKKTIKTTQVDGVHYPRLYARGVIWDKLNN